MRFNRLQNYLKEKSGNLLAFVQNGECRFLERSETSDDQGFISSSYQAKTTDFLPCVWHQTKIDENIVATQTRALIGYKITIPLSFDYSVKFTQKDRIELRTIIDEISSTVDLEICARMNRSEIGWVIYATELE